MPSFEPLVLTEAAQRGASSMAWRCTACARVYLFAQEVGRPEECKDCEASQFVETGHGTLADLM